MIVKVLGKVWTIKFVTSQALGGKRWGWCDNETNEIWLWNGLKGKRAVEILLHELIHAACWHLDEEFVDQAAKDFATALSKMGVLCKQKCPLRKNISKTGKPSKSTDGIKP